MGVALPNTMSGNIGDKMLEVPREQAVWIGWQGSGVFLSRTAIMAALWWVLTEGAAGSWVVGAPVAVLCGALSACMLPPLRWSFTGACRFWPFFLWNSLRGALDVAWRTFHRRLPLDPGIVEHRSRSSLILAEVSVANTVSLLPGTLTVDVDQRNLYVHALDKGREVRESLERSERIVAALFGTSLTAAEIDRRVEEPE